MQRISTTTKAIDLYGAGKHGFKDGNLAVGIIPTDLDAAWFNDKQEELLNVVEGAGLVPDGASFTQLRDAISIMVRKQSAAIASATGSADVLIGAFTPEVPALVNGLTVYLRAASANATAAPTFTPHDGTVAAKAIVKGNDLALVAGDIAGAGHWLTLKYDLTLDKWALMNPALGVGILAALSEIKTSMYPTFAAALAAAAGKHLVINSIINITANTTIPNTISSEVVKPGFFVISPGVTLTIAGAFDAGEYTIFGGEGSIVFAVTSRSRDIPAWRGGFLSAVFSQSRTLLQSPTEVGGAVHAFEDNNTINFTNPQAPNSNAYASFDAQTQIIGTGAYDHQVSFQARPTFSGSGSIWDRWDGFNWLPTHNGSGTVANARAFRAENPMGNGPIGFLAGFYTEKLTRGAENYGFFIQTPSNIIRTEAGVAAQIRLQGNGQVGGYGLLVSSDADSAANILQTANKPLKFGTNNVTNSMLTETGRWKFGTLIDEIGNQTQIESVGNNGIVSKVTGGIGSACFLNWNTATAGDNLFQGFYTEATIPNIRGSIDYNRASNVLRVNTTSDRTLKTRIGPAPVEKSLEILDSTVLEEYFWNEDSTEKPQIGPFAQDLYTSFKGSVSVGGDYEETVSAVTEQRLISPAVEAVPASAMVDEKGNPLVPAIEAQDAVYENVIVTPEHTVTKYRPWGVDKTAFSFHLIAAYKHQKQQIATLEERLFKLEAK